MVNGKKKHNMITFILETQLKWKMFVLKISKGQLPGHDQQKLNFCVHHKDSSWHRGAVGSLG